MAGVRGFKDPNVETNAGVPVLYQKTGNLTTKATSLLPCDLNYLGGHYNEATQCVEAGSNGWDANQAALNKDQNDNWPRGNTPWSWGHFTRKDVPVHWAIEEGFTVKRSMFLAALLTIDCFAKQQRDSTTRSAARMWAPLIYRSTDLIGARTSYLPHSASGLRQRMQT